MRVIVTISLTGSWGHVYPLTVFINSPSKGWGMRKLFTILIALSLLANCKSLVRDAHYFEPTVATEASGKKVAKQLILLTSSSDSDIEKRIASDPQLEEKLNKILLTEAKQNAVADTLRNLLSWPNKLMLWQNKEAAADLQSDDAIKIEQAIAEGGLIPSNISVENYNPKILWRRSFDNGKLSTLAKLNFGPFNALIYTVAPDKSLYNMDSDNLFADTVVLYSDDLNTTLNEAGQAIRLSDKIQKETKSGWYTLGRLLSPVRLYREAIHMGKAFRFNDDQEANAESNSYGLVFTAFGAYLATAIFVGDEIVSMAKAATGRKITRLSKWIHDRAEEISKLKVFNRAKNVDRGKQHMTRLGRRAVRMGLALSVVLSAYLVGQIMEAKVDAIAP